MSDAINKMIDKYTNVGMNIIDAFIIFIIGWYGTKILLHIMTKMMKKSNVDPIVINFVKSIVNVGLKIIVVITVIGQLGVSVTSLVAVLTTAGAAIVLGLQDSMKGVVSGIIILFAKPFVKGDTIEVGNYVGKIQEIQLLYTILMTFDNKMVVIPNNELASSTFVNYSHEDIRRVDMSMDVHYDSDVELAKKIILRVIDEHPYALKEPIPYVRVSEYKDHAITIGLRVWTKTENYYDLKDDLLEQIKYAFDKEGVQIPYQQFDIHVHHTNNS
ncbi:MAG: mechanosensitive ion channel family protein [Coprobacillus cateniformis]|uniref:mechanosensitive ion channel family protein n=1 Tax=Longibaculum muris TaxID=1796628 RepID=UPI003AB26D53|nr:mechanosensitive ion channel family protein [Coprobacillus cateniformis]